jgi:hypothetical protein
MKKILPNNLIKIEDICVLLIGYNRPELLQKRIIELHNSLVTNIHISIDGGVESTTSEMEEVKISAKNILNNKKLILNHHKHNLGLVLHATAEISKVLNLYKYVIVLEDDVKISKNFINNMVAGLNKLEELGLRGIVSGYSPLFQDTFNNKWRKTHICFLWGWACSSDVWKVYNYDLSTVEVENRLLESKTWKKLNSYQKKFWLYKIKEVQKNPLSTWDPQLIFYSFVNNFTNLTPVFSIVGNEGFMDTRAVHTKGKKPSNIKNFNLNTEAIKSMSKFSKFYSMIDFDNYYLAIKGKFLRYLKQTRKILQQYS